MIVETEVHECKESDKDKVTTEEGPSHSDTLKALETA